MKRYFVSYAHEKGFGNADVTVEDNFSITEIESDLKKMNKADLKILFFKKWDRKESW